MCTDLTPQERALLQALARGLSEQEIAHCYSLSPAIVHTTLTTVLQKLQVSSKLEAIFLALQTGLLPFPSASDETLPRAPLLQGTAPPPVSIARQQMQIVMGCLGALAYRVQLPPADYDTLQEALRAAAQVQAVLDEL